jgi:hypothetical protein
MFAPAPDREAAGDASRARGQGGMPSVIEVTEMAGRLRASVRAAVELSEPTLEVIMATLLAGGHLLIEDHPGDLGPTASPEAPRCPGDGAAAGAGGRRHAPTARGNVCGARRRAGAVLRARDRTPRAGPRAAPLLPDCPRHTGRSVANPLASDPLRPGVGRRLAPGRAGRMAPTGQIARHNRASGRAVRGVSRGRGWSRAARSPRRAGS